MQASTDVHLIIVSLKYKNVFIYVLHQNQLSCLSGRGRVAEPAPAPDSGGEAQTGREGLHAAPRDRRHRDEHRVAEAAPAGQGVAAAGRAESPLDPKLPARGGPMPGQAALQVRPQHTQRCAGSKWTD